jgi:hypothetical protein
MDDEPLQTGDSCRDGDDGPRHVELLQPGEPLRHAVMVKTDGIDPPDADACPPWWQMVDHPPTHESALAAQLVFSTTLPDHDLLTTEVLVAEEQTAVALTKEGDDVCTVASGRRLSSGDSQMELARAEETCDCSRQDEEDLEADQEQMLVDHSWDSQFYLAVDAREAVDRASGDALAAGYCGTCHLAILVKACDVLAAAAARESLDSVLVEAVREHHEAGCRVVVGQAEVLVEEPHED